MAIIIAQPDRWGGGHDVSILRAPMGRVCGEERRAKTSMMVMGPPQHGQRGAAVGTSSFAASLSSPRSLRHSGLRRRNPRDAVLSAVQRLG